MSPYLQSAYHAPEHSVKAYDTGSVPCLLHVTKLCLHNSGDTLQNCTLELATLGDLKLVEKPQPVVLAPRDFCNIKANVKVASTENGIIFGNIGECCVHTFLSTFGFFCKMFVNYAI
jgi:hypothetical protein